ncbi:alpha/beta hydrolase family protein [Metapseudomonas boanensis]|uniref:Alpha/beta hydrolase family protein n=1 Tax=Metapseudomonas boanensis TaxID=2822138 RepID=A0ABS5XN67_9GAMM|nr:alpha/beta hydrolase family protein [Pseudomonas boanensis]MBT8769141.1 alpha/beta hydrolase family protein [Pseudomonas boanensis]
MPRAPRPTLAALCFAFLTCGLPALAADATPAKQDAADNSQEMPAVTRAPLQERSQVEAAGLERQLPENEQQQLQAGDETFLALWRPANVGEPEGLVILLPGDGENADWPLAVGPLRRKLPDAGWSTLSLSLPDPKGDEPPPRPEKPSKIDRSEPVVSAEKAAEDGPSTTEQAGSAEPNTDPAPPALSTEGIRKAHSTRVSARIQAALTFARQSKPTTIVFLGHGTGAYWAAQYLAVEEPTDIRNLLLVDAQQPAGYDPILDKLLPELKLATGDFYYREAPADRSAAQERLQASKRQKHPAYIQVAMNGLPGDRATEQEQLVRRIRGWLSLQLQAGAPPGR